MLRHVRPAGAVASIVDGALRIESAGPVRFGLMMLPSLFAALGTARCQGRDQPSSNPNSLAMTTEVFADTNCSGRQTDHSQAEPRT